MIELEMVDISYETFGKYQYCTMYEGRWYADSDFVNGKPKKGAIPSPESFPTRQEEGNE